MDRKKRRDRRTGSFGRAADGGQKAGRKQQEHSMQRHTNTHWLWLWVSLVPPSFCWWSAIPLFFDTRTHTPWTDQAHPQTPCAVSMSGVSQATLCLEALSRSPVLWLFRLRSLCFVLGCFVSAGVHFDRFSAPRVSRCLPSLFDPMGKEAFGA